MNGWIKLHRKLLDNDFLKKDTNAFKVFVTLLLLVDRTTGIWCGGRFQLANHCGLKPVTLYKATKRLENAKMVTLTSNNKFTSYLVTNWLYYQGDGNTFGNNTVTTREQQREHSNKKSYKEVKNKEGELNFLEEGSNPFFRRWCCDTDKSVPFKDWVKNET